MKRILALIFAVVTAFTLAACSGETADNEKTDDGQTSASAQNTYSLDITEQVKEWKTGEKNGVSYVYAEKVMYCESPVVGAKQCLNIYVPAAYMNTDGTLNRDAQAGGYTCATAPILYINSTGAYLGKQPYKITEASETLAGKEGWYYNYLKEGFVLVFSGARGRADYSQANNDKATGKPYMVNGKEVTAETKFTPEKPDGEVTVTFEFDASGIHNKSAIVVFETMYQDDLEILVHADLEDSDQTVTIDKPGTPQTGDTLTARYFILGGAALVFAAIILLAYLRGRKRD